MSALTCTLSVWQGQLAGNGTMELDSKTGAEYLKTYDTRKNTKSNHQVLGEGLLEGTGRCWQECWKLTRKVTEI